MLRANGWVNRVIVGPTGRTWTINSSSNFFRCGLYPANSDASDKPHPGAGWVSCNRDESSAKSSSVRQLVWPDCHANISRIAQGVGIGSNLLWRWRRELESGTRKPFPSAGVARDHELLALKPELVRVRRSGIFFAMRRRSSPRSRPEVRDDPRSPQSVSGLIDVPMSEGLAQRLPCLMHAYAQSLAAVQRTAAREDPSPPCR